MPTLRKLFIDLGRKQADVCESNPGLYCEQLIVEASQRTIMMNVYRAMLNENMMVPIEKIPREQQQKYWDAVKADNRDRFRDVEKLKNICRIHYLIDVLLIS